MNRINALFDFLRNSIDIEFTDYLTEISINSYYDIELDIKVNGFYFTNVALTLNRRCNTMYVYIRDTEEDEIIAGKLVCFCNISDICSFDLIIDGHYKSF